MVGVVGPLLQGMVERQGFNASTTWFSASPMWLVLQGRIAWVEGVAVKLQCSYSTDARCSTFVVPLEYRCVVGSGEQNAL